MSELPLVQTRTLGDFRIHALETGTQRLDGGAMFGVVPKPLWERRIPADERNRIPLALRCLLVETRDELVLIETGLGNKESEKFIQIYGVDNVPPAGSDDPDHPLEGLSPKAADDLWASRWSVGDRQLVFLAALALDQAPTRVGDLGNG